jgi:hypothetical protein
MSLASSLSNINYLAVLAAGAAHMATGLIWFNYRLFGKQWIRLTRQELKPAKEWIAAGIAGHMLTALAAAVIICLADATTVLEGLAVAILIWIGFVVTLETGELIWEKIPFRLFLIRIGNHLVALSLAGIILALWR